MPAEPCLDRDPDLMIAGLKVWVLRRQYPDSDDYWDGNWVEVDATCEADGSHVRARGPFIHLSELGRFRDACAAIHEELTGEASLDCMEPTLGATLTFSDSLGNIDARISLSPNHLEQTHDFLFRIDQSHLPYILRGLSAILEKYPPKSVP